MGLIIVLTLVSVVSLFCLIDAIRVKRRNYGFIFMELLGVSSNILCSTLLRGNNVAQIRVGLIVFFVSQAWLYFGAVWTIAGMSRFRHFKRYMIPVFVTSIYKTVIILSTVNGRRVFNMAKHIFFGRTWWVAETPAGIPPMIGLQGYYIAMLIEAVIMLVQLFNCCRRSDKLFRIRYIVIIVCEIVYLLPEFATFIYKLPAWIMGTSVSVVILVWHYYVNHYQTVRLRNWSLVSFANEMTDGFVLYDEYDDPIYMNNLLKNTFTKEEIEDFRDIHKLDEWIEQKVKVVNAHVREYVRDDGSKVYFNIKKIVLGREGLSFGTIYILHDTTQSVMRLLALEETNEELERVARMKSDFLANMSHEIRTPMNAVIGMAELALREDLSPKVADYITQIQNSGRNLLNIINDILDFSKIEAGKMEIVNAPYEPMSEIHDIANVLVTRIGDKSIELFVDVDVNLPHLLEGDAMRIRQILINLANNAIKFTEEGRVSIKLTCDKTSDDELMLTYHVTDTGIGIKEEDLGKLFQNFVQVDSKRNRAVEGTGLGLAISKSLAEAMGGSIGVSSVYGQGSDFYFSIPQKVIDPSLDIVVTDAANKCAYVLNDDIIMVEKFISETNKLAVETRHIFSVDEYIASGKNDYIFFEPCSYDEKMKAFLNKNKNVIGVMLVDLDSDFRPQQDNLHIMRRPLTTLAMLAALNGVEERELVEEAEYYKVDFTAPDAKVLIVDDNHVNITIARGLLESTGMKCEEALSGKEAIEKVKKEKYDIIFMDHMMPEMDGIEATRIIRDTIPDAANTPIIALTANVMEGVREMFIEDGMNDFVAKPIDVRILMSVVRYWLPDYKIKEAGTVASGTMNATSQDDSSDIIYPFLDSSTAIENLGNVTLYHKIVEEYYRSGADKADAIEKAYNSEDWKDYTIKVHAIKSASRQIGAMKLGDMAEHLEKAGNEGDLDTIRGGQGKLMNDYRDLLGKLAPYFKTEEETSATEIDTETLKELADKLNIACDNLDMDGMEEVREEMKKYSYPESVADKVKQLYKAIDNLDTDECGRLMDEILRG